MLFPRAAVAALAEFSDGAFDGPAGAGEDDAAAGVSAAEVADAPPRLLTYETRASISAGFTLNATMPADFMAGVGAFRIAVN